MDARAESPASAAAGERTVRLATIAAGSDPLGRHRWLVAVCDRRRPAVGRVGQERKTGTTRVTTDIRSGSPFGCQPLVTSRSTRMSPSPVHTCQAPAMVGAPRRSRSTKRHRCLQPPPVCPAPKWGVETRSAPCGPPLDPTITPVPPSTSDRSRRPCRAHRGAVGFTCAGLTATAHRSDVDLDEPPSNQPFGRQATQGRLTPHRYGRLAKGTCDEGGRIVTSKSGGASGARRWRRPLVQGRPPCGAHEGSDKPRGPSMGR